MRNNKILAYFGWEENWFSIKKLLEVFLFMSETVYYIKLCHYVSNDLKNTTSYSKVKQC